MDTVSEFRGIRCVSQIRFHNSMSRFPRPGPAGCRSPVSTVLSRHYDFLPPVSRRFVAFARRYHVIALVLSLPRGKCHHASLELVTRYLRPGSSSVETTGPPKFLGNPNHPFAHALRLRQDGSLQTNFRATAWPSLRERQRLSQRDLRSSITWLSNSLSTLRHARYLTQRKTRFRPSVKRYRTGFPPAGSQSKVSNSHHVNHPPRQASWRNPRFSLGLVVYRISIFG